MNILDRWKMPLLRLILALGLALFFYHKAMPDAEQIRVACSVMASVSVTLLGFLITAVAIISALAQETLILNMKKTGHYLVLMREVFLTCRLLLLTLVACLITLILPDNLSAISMAFVFFSLFLSLFYTLSAGHKFFNVISAV